MKTWKKLASLIAGVSIILTYSNCATQQTSSVQSVSDGYIVTANEKLLKNVRDGSKYAITFIALGTQKPAPKVIRQALSDPSRHSTVEGKATKVGANKLKITTTSKVTIDLTQPFGTFWGLNSKKISDFLSGKPGRGAGCRCYGVDDFHAVNCDDPKSLVCCESGC